MVEGRDLTFFVTVAEELHFGRAAARLHITPASVTQRIQDLEAELAVRLFDRSSRRVTLTPAGRQLLPTARSGLQGLTAVTELARSLALGATGHARIGLAPNLGDVGARLIGELVVALPGLETVGASMWSAEAQDALLAGDIEVAVVRGPAATLGIRSVLIGEHHDGYVAIASDDYLAQLDQVPLHAFQGRPFLITERALAPHVHDRTIGFFAGHGVAPVWRHHRLLGYDQIGPFVAAGYASTLVHSTVSSLDLPGVCVRPLAESAPSYEIRVAWRANDDSALAHLLAARI